MTRFSTSVPGPLVDRLNRWAGLLGRRRNWLVRAAIEQLLDKLAAEGQREFAEAALQGRRTTHAASVAALADRRR